MSLLTQQLALLKSKTPHLQIGPNLPQPTLILTSEVARHTSIDVIYAIALISYANLSKACPNITKQGDTIFHEENKGINRNLLSKNENALWKERLIKFMIGVGEYFLNEDGQKIIEYLLRNYKVNVFQAQALCIIFLPYWNNQIYGKLINNIDKKWISIKMAFLLPYFNENSPRITLPYLAKSLSYSFTHLDSLLLYTRESMRTHLSGQSQGWQQEEIQMGQAVQKQEGYRSDAQYAHRQIWRFVVQLFFQMISASMSGQYHHILAFINSIGKSNKMMNHEEYRSLVMLLVARLIAENAITDVCLLPILKKLIKTHLSSPSLFPFVMIVWQRRPSLFNPEFISQYIVKLNSFAAYVSSFPCSLHMILISLLKAWAKGVDCSEIILAASAKIKESEFWQRYQKQLISEIIKLIEEGLSNNNTKVIIQIISKNFLFEIADHFNKKPISSNIPQTASSESTSMLSLLSTIYGKNLLQTVPVLCFDLDSIYKIVSSGKKTKKEVSKIVQKTIDKIDHQDEKEMGNQQSKPKISLIELLRKKGSDIESQIDWSEEKTVNFLKQLLNKYYHQNQGITESIATQIIQNKPTLYTQEFISIDLANKRFSNPLHHLTVLPSLQNALLCLGFLGKNLEIADEIVGRQLIRASLAIVSSLSDVMHKKIITFFNKLFKNILNQQLNELSPAHLPKTAAILIKLSTALLTPTLLRKGKFHRLMHNHTRILAEMILQMHNKELVQSGKTFSQTLIQDDYLKIVKLFGTQHLAMINIGLIEQLTRKNLDYQPLNFFVAKVLVPSISKPNLRNQKGSQSSSISHPVIALSIAKSLAFMIQILPQKQEVPHLDVNTNVTAGLPKSILIDFFGLVHQKFKRVLSRKIILFVDCLLNASKFKESLSLYLENGITDDYQNSKEMKKLMQYYTEQYKILAFLSERSLTNSLLASFTSLLGTIPNLFPLEQRLSLFLPLLPLKSLYKYLGDQLQAHSPSKTDFALLAKMICVNPSSVDAEWVKFVKECMKRGYFISENILSWAVSQKDQKNIDNLTELICEVGEYCKEILLPILPQAMAIVLSYCKTPNDYTLALIYRLLKNLNQLVSPYIQDLLLAVIELQSNFMAKFMEDICNFLTPPTLIGLAKSIHKEVSFEENSRIAFFNCVKFMKEACKRGTGDSLAKVLQGFSGRIIESALQSQYDIQDIINEFSDVFQEMALKLNENQLRKLIIDLIRWSEAKSLIQPSLPFNHKKILVVCVFNHLSSKLQELFTPFFGYIFESMIKDISNINTYFQGQSSKGKSKVKRVRQQSEYSQRIISLYLKNLLKSLQLLFTFDTEKNLIDAGKFDQLSDPLADLYLCQALGLEKYEELTKNSLSPTILAICNNTADDYQLKSLNYKILLHLRSKSTALHFAIFSLMDQMIDQIQDRFLIFVNDMVPFLIQDVGSRHDDVKKVVKRIISKIQDLSGDKIENYLK